MTLQPTRVWGLILILLGLLGTNTVFAQPTTITIAVPNWQADLFPSDEVFTDFEAQYNVNVETIILEDATRRSLFITQSDDGTVTDFIDNVRTYAATADVVPVSNHILNPLATRTGAYLNLQPLIQADTDANIEDFYPATINAFKWDNGTWALPMSLQLRIVQMNSMKTQ